MSWLTTLRLAAAGGAGDRLRAILTTLGAALGTMALLAAATVLAIRPQNGPYASNLLNERGLRPGVIITLLLLCVPVIVFVGQCARVGAPARDRRLAAMRMAGATPRDIVRIAALETAIAAGLGAVGGAVAFLWIRSRIRTPTFGLRRQWPTDVDLSGVVVAAVVLIVALAAAVAAAITLRRVAVTPFGVARQVRQRPPTVVPLVLFVGGTAALAAITAISEALALGSGITIALGIAFFAATAAGLLSGTASLTFALGSFLAPRVRRPWLLLAARRMIAAPFTASRASVAVLLTVMIGAGVYSAREDFRNSDNLSDEPLYASAFTLLEACLVIAATIGAASLLVVTAESIVERRRTMAALVAAGTPRGTLAQAMLTEVLLPLAVGIGIAAGAGTLIIRSIFNDATSNATGETVALQVPWVSILGLMGGTFLAAAVLTAAALVFLRPSTSVDELRAT